MKQQIERLITKYSDPQNIGARSCYPEFVADLEILADSIEQLPAPLFTRTVYSVADLHSCIDSLENLDLKNYVIGRDVEEREVFVPCQPNDKVYRDRWIIKVYGEVTE